MSSRRPARTVSILLSAIVGQIVADDCPDPRHWPGHPIYDNATAAYKAPMGRRVMTVLGSADSRSIAQYGFAVEPLFKGLRSTSSLSLLAGGCAGLMGIGSAFCAKGPLGEMCNGYSGFWHVGSARNGNHSCLEYCETKSFMKIHLLANSALEEQLITSGQTAGVGDGFLMLPGGVGTTRELYDVLQANFEYYGVNKPIFCLNVATGHGRGFYDGVVHWMQQLFGDSLLRPYAGSNGSSMFISSNATELAAAIDDWAWTGTLPDKLRLENLLNITLLGQTLDDQVVV